MVSQEAQLRYQRTSSRSGFLVRRIKVLGDGRYAGNVLSMLTANTSSQWKDPSCVPMRTAPLGTPCRLLIILQCFNDSTNIEDI